VRSRSSTLRAADPPAPFPHILPTGRT
jgi:hypothetical protein